MSAVPNNVRPLHANRDVTQEFRRPQHTENRNPGGFVAKGHDRALQHAEQDRRMLRIDTMSGYSFEGRMVRRDRYTITIRTEEGREKCFFKHGIESFEVLPVVPVAALPKVEEGA